MVLDIKKLKDVDFVLFAQFMAENGSAIIQRINDTTRAHIAKGEVPCHEPEFAATEEFKIKHFDCWYSTLYRRFCANNAKGSVLTLIFPIAVYLYECYGISCSKQILGCEAQTVPPLWLRSWLDQVNCLSADDTEELYALLESEPPVRCETAFVLKSRIQEMAAAEGVRFDDFCMYPGLLTEDRPQVQGFINMELQETGNSFLTMRPALGSQKMLRFLVNMCVRYQVSPEYLLLQDYSEFAVTPQGRFYPPSQRKLMSMLLSAGAATRTKAIGFVMASSTKAVANGRPVPALELFNAEFRRIDDDKPLNVMEAISSSNKTSKNERENQIVDSLKIRLLDILARSGEPVSSNSLFKVVDGHHRLAKKALLQLEKEGKVVMIPNERFAAFWQIKK